MRTAVEWVEDVKATNAHTTPARRLILIGEAQENHDRFLAEIAALPLTEIVKIWGTRRRRTKADAANCVYCTQIVLSDTPLAQKEHDKLFAGRPCFMK